MPSRLCLQLTCRHPCDTKVNVVSDLGLRLAEGLHDLHIDQSLAPTREALSSAYAAGTGALVSGGSSLFKAFDGVRNDISSRLEADRARREKERSDRAAASPSGEDSPATPSSAAPVIPIAEIGKTLGGIGTGIGSFFGSKYAAFKGGQGGTQDSKGLRPMSLSPSKK